MGSGQLKPKIGNNTVYITGLHKQPSTTEKKTEADTSRVRGKHCPGCISVHRQQGAAGPFVHLGQRHERTYTTSTATAAHFLSKVSYCSQSSGIHVDNHSKKNLKT